MGFWDCYHSLTLTFLTDTGSIINLGKQGNSQHETLKQNTHLSYKALKYYSTNYANFSNVEERWLIPKETEADSKELSSSLKLKKNEWVNECMNEWKKEDPRQV